MIYWLPLSNTVKHMRPILIKYQRTLDSRFDSIESGEILNYLQKLLKKQGVSSFDFGTDSTLNFRVKHSWLLGDNWNKWNSIRQGRIEIRESENKRILTYEIDIIYLIFSSSIFILMGIISSIIFKTIIPLLFFSLIALLLTWLIAWIRHDDNVTGLLNECIQYKNKTSKIH